MLLINYSSPDLIATKDRQNEIKMNKVDKMCVQSEIFAFGNVTICNVIKVVGAKFGSFVVGERAKSALVLHHFVKKNYTQLMLRYLL